MRRFALLTILTLAAQMPMLLSSEPAAACSCSASSDPAPSDLAGFDAAFEGRVVARAFGAERTPHYFLFGPDDALVYSGRMDNSPRDASKAQTHELEDAIEDMLAGRPARIARTDAIGCNVKWWDQDAHWMPKEACDLDYLHQREAKKG